MKYNNTFLYPFALLTAMALQPISQAAADEQSLAEKVRTCSIKSTDKDRLQCFDSLAKMVVEIDDQEADKGDTLPGDLGGGKFEKNGKTPEENRGLVTSCKQSHDGRWFFIFENGQVWKQSNSDRRSRRYKNCNFPVTIKKDGFGYKMNIQELSRELRVRRIK